MKAPIPDVSRLGRAAHTNAQDAATSAARRMIERAMQEAMVTGALAVVGYDLIKVERPDPDSTATSAIRYLYRAPGKVAGEPRTLPILADENSTGLWEALRALADHAFRERLKERIAETFPTDDSDEITGMPRREAKV